MYKKLMILGIVAFPVFSVGISSSSLVSPLQQSTDTTRLAWRQPMPLTKLTIDNEPTLPKDAPLAILTLHGLGSNGKDFVEYCREHTALPVVWRTLDFPHSSIHTSVPHLICAFGQERSQKVVIEHYNKLVAAGYRVILWGESDGAATAAMVAACYDLKNLAGLLLISPYADPTKIIERVLPKPVYASTQSTLESSDYVSHDRSIAPFNPSGPTPVKVAAAISHDVPTRVVASKGDRLIPCSETQRVPDAMKQGGHTKVDFVTLEYGEHANLLYGRSGKLHRQVVENFLRKCGVSPQG